jgi:prolyl-tRNA synthetase
VGLSIATIVDPEAAALADFVCGANRDGFHCTGANWERDAIANTIADIRNVCRGDPAPDGQGKLEFLRGIEVGHIFQLGSVYSAPMQATVLDRDGATLTPVMGCYGMGVTRLVAAIIEQKHDERGIIWPEPLAPFAVHVVALNYAKSDDVRGAADAFAARCRAAGLETLLDDRDERPGVKFADADLIGIPHRVVIGERGLRDGTFEYRRRADPDTEALSPDDAFARIVGA